MYAWLVKYQDVISGFIAGVSFMAAGEQFLSGNHNTGWLYLFVSAVNLLMVNHRLVPKE